MLALRIQENDDESATDEALLASVYFIPFLINIKMTPLLISFLWLVNYYFIYKINTGLIM